MVGFRAYLKSCTRVTFLAVVVLCSLFSNSSAASARYMSFAEAGETLRMYADSGMPGSDLSDARQWDQWVGQQNHDVRERVDRGTDDSISNLVLYGTSFTASPRLKSSEEAITSAGRISAQAQLRIRDLAGALRNTSNNNGRVQFVRAYLKRKGVARASIEAFLSRNLIRFANEQIDYQKRLEEARGTHDPARAFLARSTLYKTRGLSVDTSLLPNFALEETLRSLVAKNVLKRESVQRIAVIGPGLDFVDKRDGYDFYPQQTIQPFAVIDAVLRLGLGRPADLRVITLDLNAAVNAHMAKLVENGRRGRPYLIQLPRDNSADWSPAAISYWQHFGELVGKPTEPLPVPETLPNVALRAVAIRPDVATDVEPRDLNIVAERIDFPKGEGFDLIVATNILVYYDTFQQALAMSNIAHMMNSNGIFLANNPLPTAHDPRLIYLGRKSVSFASNGEYGDDVVVYRRQ